MPHIFVQSVAQWHACLARLQDEPRLAIDLEANSMFAYREQVCLVQISTATEDFIIDPLAVKELDGLGQLVEDAAVEKVFHAAEYDLILLKRQYGWQCQYLFDTMWAARILAYGRYGLANLLQTIYGVDQDKKFQKANWCKRPLTADMLTYAQLDTHYLLPLRDYLGQQLQANGRWAEAQEIFAEQTQVVPNPHTFDPNGFWHVSGAYDLERYQQAILKALYLFRDQEAARRNQPLFKVFSDKTLLALAKTTPKNLHELSDIHGMTDAQIQRYGRQLLNIIRESSQHTPPPFPKRTQRPPDDVYARYEKLHNWRKEKGQARGVESDVILSRDAMWAIAWRDPQTVQHLDEIRSLGSWRRQTYGAEIVQLLQAT